MVQSIHLHTIADVFKLFNLSDAPQHPLIGIVDFRKVKDHVSDGTRISADFYSIIFKNYARNNVKYGRKIIDFQDGSLICIAPNQVIEMDDEDDIEVSDTMLGWGLFFHPDLIRTTSLQDKMRHYNFFSYAVSESLHLSEKEKNILYDCVLKIESELQENIDVHSQAIIVSNVELLLNYCSRFYGRQFITRRSSNHDVVIRIEEILTRHFTSTEENASGLPTVKSLSEQVHLSPGYLSDLLKKETGKNAQDFIHHHLIEAAKTSLLNTNKSVSEIAYALGFEYPQYFNKLFKQKTGKTPVEFRNLN
jgi:AraC-like DNA-binding protein